MLRLCLHWRLNGRAVMIPSRCAMPCGPVANPPGEVVGPGDIARALELVRDGEDINYIGASGDVDFDEFGNVVSSMRVWTVKENKIEDTDIYALPGDAINLSSIR